VNAIGPGDWVECAQVGPIEVRGYGVVSSNGTPSLSIGALYQVEALLGPDAWGDDWLLLVGRRCPANTRGAYRVRRFRPVYRRREDLIQQLMQPVSLTVRDLVSAD
jgi:hypothetical protein